jgi:hypothetical protein
MDNMRTRRQRLPSILPALLLSFSFMQALRADEPWAWIDLSPAINNALITESITDEGTAVVAEPEKAFLIIPIRYDPAGGNRVINRATFKSKDVHGFYGIRLLPDPTGQVDLEKLGTDPIYEKWELKKNATGRGQVTARNSSPPRLAEKEKDPKARPPRRPSITIPASGWLAVIIEIPKSMRKLSFGWAELSESQLDLGFIKHCRDPIPEPPRIAPDTKTPEPPAALLDIIKLIGGKNAPMEALAIRRLATVRGQWSTQSDPELLNRIDRAVLESSLSPTQDVSVAVWFYLASESAVQPPTCWITPRSLERVAQAPQKEQRSWLDLISNGLGLRTTSAAWSGATWPPNAEPASLRVNCIALLTSLLRCEDREIISSAWEILLTRFAPNMDLAFLQKVSNPAGEALLDRIGSIKNRDFESSCIRALMNRLDVRNAKRIAAQARRMGIGLRQSDDPILLLWEGLTGNAQREAYLVMLTGLNLSEVRYAPRVAAIIDYCMSNSPSGDEKKAALRFLLKIGEFDGNNSEVFSLLIVRTAQDPVVRGLVHVLAMGEDKIALDAALSLIRRGFAEEAARTIVEKLDSSRQLKVIQTILNTENLPTDIRAAFAGFLLRSNAPELAAMALEHLSRVAGRVPAEDRWRLIAAVRAGVNPVELDQLAATLKGSPGTSALRWLHELGHMSAQDRQRLAGAKTPAERVSRLKEIDYRRARVVDGRYGAIAIVETMTARRTAPSDDHPDGQLYWDVPRRVSLGLPEFQIDSSDEMHEKSSKPYRIRVGKTAIGQGVISDRPGIIGSPATFSIALGSLQWIPTLGGTAGVNAESQPPDPGQKEPIGPLFLATRRVLDPPRAGTMTIDLYTPLMEALTATKQLQRISTNSLPRPWNITLRYAAFGSFYGVGEARSVSTEGAKDGDLMIRNVMIILERKD